MYGGVVAVGCRLSDEVKIDEIGFDVEDFCTEGCFVFERGLLVRVKRDCCGRRVVRVIDSGTFSSTTGGCLLLTPPPPPPPSL